MKKLRNEIKLSLFFLSILVIAMMFVSPVFGHAPGSVETEEEQSRVYMKIGTVTVSEKAGYLTTADSPGSVDVIGAEQLDNENVDFSMQALKKLPGVYYQDWNQGVIHGSVAIRGFDPNMSDSVALYVDGIPNNMSTGWMDMRPFFPFELERIELVKGTFDPRYGLNNIAGNVNVFTKRGGNYSKVKLLHGSFQTSEGNAIIAREEDGFSQTYFVGYRRTNGYRDHSDVKKGAVSGKWFYTTDDNRLSVGAIARFFDMDANSAGYLTEEQLDDNPEQMQEFSRTDGGVQENRQISLHADYDFTDSLHYSFKVYTQDLERFRWVQFQPTYDQQERFTDERQSGAISTLTYETADWGVEDLKLTWGVDYQYQDSIYQRWVTNDRVREKIRKNNNYDYQQWFLGTYIAADTKVNKWLRLTGALRVDRFDGDYENKEDNIKSDMIDYGDIWQPKVGIVVTPIHGYNLFANWGRAFQIGSHTGRFNDDDLDYSKNDGWEAGIKLSPVNWLAARLSYWEQNASDEVKTDAQGDPENIGETDRDGWDIGLSVRPYEWVTLWGAYSKTNAVYTDPGYDKFGNIITYKGKDIKNIPEYTSKLGVDFVHPIGFSSSLWWESQGDYPIDEENALPRDGDYDVVNLDMAYKIKNTTFGFHIRNLFDEEYSGFVWDNSGYDYSPGDERSFYASVAFEF